MPRITRTKTVLAAVVSIAGIGCNDVEIKTNHNTEGAPRIITAAVTSESAGEAAVYCSGDEGEKLNAGLCETAGEAPGVQDAEPLGWEIRLIVNELLVADEVEDLVTLCSPDLLGDPDNNPDCFDGNGDAVIIGTIAQRDPPTATLTCDNEDVAIDGFYYPDGNQFTIPPGPGIIVHPLAPVATNAACTITVGDHLRDKDFNSMDTSKPLAFNFGTAPFSVTGTDPADGAEGIAVADLAIEVGFNFLVDSGSLNPALFELVDDADPTTPIDITVAPDGSTGLKITPDAPLNPGTAYTVTMRAGVSDTSEGVIADDLVIKFTTADASM